MNGSGPSQRAGPSRWEGEYERGRDWDDRSNGYGRPSEVGLVPLLIPQMLIEVSLTVFSLTHYPRFRPPFRIITRQILQPPNIKSYSNPLWPRDPLRVNRYRPPSGPRRHTPSPPRRSFDRERDRDWAGERQREFEERNYSSLDGIWRGNISGGQAPGIPPPRRHPPFGSASIRDRPPDRDRWDAGDRRWIDRGDDRFRDEPPRNP